MVEGDARFKLAQRGDAAHVTVVMLRLDARSIGAVSLPFVMLVTAFGKTA
jgi:hypothetical protein